MLVKYQKGRCIELYLFLTSFVFILSGLLSPLMVSSFLGQYQEVLRQGQVCLSVTVDVLADMDRVEVE